MSLQQLRTFIEVYRQRSISGAARSLGLTQPAVSQHVQALESAIERELFERRATGVIPTVAAEELAAGLGDRLDLAEAALAAARARSADMTGVVRLIGHRDFMAEVIAPRLIPLLRTGMRIALHNGDRETIGRALIERQHDLGLCAYADADRSLRMAKIHEETIFAVAAPDVARRLLAAPDLGAALLAEPILAYNLERPLVDDWLKLNRMPATATGAALIGQDLRCLRLLLNQGFGWTALPGFMCADQIAQGQLVELPPPVGRPVHPYYLVWTPAALRHPRVAYARNFLMGAPA
jgi:DNA-binding transcriptional LysR family regulator